MIWNIHKPKLMNKINSESNNCNNHHPILFLVCAVRDHGFEQQLDLENVFRKLDIHRNKLFYCFRAEFSNHLAKLHLPAEIADWLATYLLIPFPCPISCKLDMFKSF